MCMIWHDHKSIEKKRVEGLNTVQRIDCFTRIGIICEYRYSFTNISRYKKGEIGLKRMTLGHGAILQHRGPEDPLSSDIKMVDGLRNGLLLMEKTFHRAVELKI